MDYYKKYLKYKTKFLQLKNLQYGGSGGGGSGEVNPIKSIEDKYKTQVFQVKCFTTGFKQHVGECWNDSIMMFLCSQDEIKEVVQRKLRFLSPSEIIHLALLKNRQKLLPSLYLEKEYFNTILTNLPDYLTTMKERFNYYYNYYNEEEGKQTLPINFTGDASPRLGIECAKYGQKIILAELPEGRKNFNIGIVSLLTILSCFLLDDIELIYNIKNINKIKREDSNNIIAVYNVLQNPVGNGGHASLFYICNGSTYHFDNNQPQPKIFDFKSLLNSRITSIENKTFDDDNIFTITYDNGFSLKTFGVNLIKINESTPEDIKNKINTFFYLEYFANYNISDDPKVSLTENPFELLIDKYLKLGFDINNYSDEYGNTLLDYCTPIDRMYNINLVRIKFLISRGIDINLQDGNVNTILHVITNGLNKYIDEKLLDDEDIINIKSILEEILKLPNIRLDIKNNKGELVKSVICPSCSYCSTIGAKFCGNCGQQIKF